MTNTSNPDKLLDEVLAAMQKFECSNRYCECRIEDMAKAAIEIAQNQHKHSVKINEDTNVILKEGFSAPMIGNTTKTSGDT